uniref:ATP-grasp domain-containing protein n=1 Tax=Arcella intermedia TaxID=1963864 RepID=A0A6B2L9R0_9EUKA
MLKGAKLLNGDPIVVEQTRWKYMHVEASSQAGTMVHLFQHTYPDEPWPWSSQKKDRTVRPDFCLIRNFPLDSHGDDFKSMVLGLKFGGLGSVNSIDSVYLSMERAYQYAELLQVQKRLGDKAFELIPMNYFSNERIKLRVVEKVIPPQYQTTYPRVVKVGSAHAGRGKLRAFNESDMTDIEGVLALNTDYFTTEPFLDAAFEYRIQKIGDHYRCFVRKSDNWKQNVGNLEFEDYEVLPKHKLWADECAKMMGGLDIMALDVIVTKDGKEYVIEINDTAIGLMYPHDKEDLQHIKELVLLRMNQHFCPHLLNK